MAAAKKNDQVFVARESFVAEIDGVIYAVHQGVTRVREGHVLLKDGRDKLFAPAEDVTHYETEQATAAPGEKRGQ